MNIGNTLQHIYHESSILRLMINQEDIGMVGALYDVNTGKVTFNDFSSTIEAVSNSDETPLTDKLHKVIHEAKQRSTY